MTFLVIQPTRGTLFTRVQEAVEREFRNEGQYPAIVRTSDMRLLDARNHLAKTALKTQADIIVFLDDDVVLPEGAFKSFRTTLETSDVAIMDYPHHWHPLLSEIPPTGVTVFTQWLPGEDVSAKPVAWSGLGSVAITRKKLEELCGKEDPLFVATAHPVGVDSLGRMGLRPTEDAGLSGQERDYSGGEDTNFFLKARKHGMTLGMVKGLTAVHLRLDHAVSWVADGKYSSVHKIEESSKIEKPGNVLHMDKTLYESD